MKRPGWLAQGSSEIARLEAVVEALAGLLLDKGVIGEDELEERIAAALAGKPGGEATTGSGPAGRRRQAEGVDDQQPLSFDREGGAAARPAEADPQVVCGGCEKLFPEAASYRVAGGPYCPECFLELDPGDLPEA